jgi:hypothetical protein
MSRALALACLALILGACGTGQRVEQVVTPIEGPPPRPAAKPYVIPTDANFLIVASEAVSGPEQDIGSYVKVLVDGKEAGQTPTGPKSAEKKWGAVLPPGNHLFRFEHWVQPLPEEWTPLKAEWQPPERFVRVDGNQRTVVTLKFVDGGRRHSLQVSREPLSQKP